MNYEIRIVKRISKKNTEYKALEVKIGDKWKKLLFPNSSFEWAYLEEHLETVDLTKDKQ